MLPEGDGSDSVFAKARPSPRKLSVGRSNGWAATGEGWTDRMADAAAGSGTGKAYPGVLGGTLQSTTASSPSNASTR
jgi:hypothetical protein